MAENLSKTYRAELWDGPLRWLVKANQGDQKYLVDLGIPECQCRWHQCEVRPALRKGLQPRKMCVHYHTALNAFAPWAVEQFKKFDQNIPDHEQT